MSPVISTMPLNSRSLKVLALSLGSGLSMVANMAVGMVAARLLSKHDYATIRQTFLAYEFASPLLLLGLPNALYYFVPRASGGRRGVLIDSVALLTLLGFVFSMFILLGGDVLLARQSGNSDLRKTLPWVAIYPLFMMPVAGIAAILVIVERVRMLAVYNTLVSLIQAACAVVAIYVTRSYALPIAARIVVAGLALPIGLGLMFHAVTGPWRVPNAATMTAMVRYAAPLGLATMLGSITLQIHAMIVAALCAPEVFAVYINGAIEIPVIGIVVGSITTVIFADMSNACARGDRAEALRIFQLAGVKSACVLFPAMIYFFIAAKPFIVLLYSSGYTDSVVPFRIYLAVLPARIVLYGAALMALGMSRVVLLRSVFDLIINAILCFIFVWAFGYNGAALGLVITLYLWSVPYNLIKIAQGYEVRWRDLMPWRRLAGVMAISLSAAPLAWGVLRLLADEPSWLQLVLSWIAYTALVAAVLLHGGYVVPPTRFHDWSKAVRWNRI